MVTERLQVFEADATRDEGWAIAFQKVNYVLHVASPFPPVEPEDPNELIIPAKEGTCRILRFATSSPSVNRVVITSYFSAIGYGHSERSRPFDENDLQILMERIQYTINQRQLHSKKHGSSSEVTPTLRLQAQLP